MSSSSPRTRSRIGELGCCWSRSSATRTLQSERTRGSFALREPGRRAAQSAETHRDVINYIANQKDYLRIYPIKVALANNPKTPHETARKLLRTLQEKDIRRLAGHRKRWL
jgi:hypothetical protein